MKMQKIQCLLLIGLALCVGCDNTKQIDPPKPYGATPTENQIKWNQMEYYAFAHFGMNTFTDNEWGFGNDSLKLFNPTSFNADQWASTCKLAGMKGIILTAKHHDGFCLWPSKYTEYSVKNSPYKDGKGDIVKEVSEACQKYGLKFGVYLSPWDRNHADYGKAGYVEYFHNQIRELLTNYGEIFEVWFDGANGGDGYYGGSNEIRKIDSKTYYQWDKVSQIVRELQPNAIIWGDAIDARWVGNEKGYADETNWSTIDISLIKPGSIENEKYLENGMMGGPDWSPAEADVSIRPGWFYSKIEDNQVKTLVHLLDIYYKSVGRNCNLLLNIPIDRRGLIHKNDSVQLMRFAQKIKEDFAHPIINKNHIMKASSVRNKSFYPRKNLTDNNLETYWTVAKGQLSGTLEIDFGRPEKFNRFVVQEGIELGQRVKAFKLEAWVDGAWQLIEKGTTIGYKRILRFPLVTASKVRFTIEDALAEPVISTLQLYNSPLLLTPPIINRNIKGEVSISSSDVGVDVFYAISDSDTVQNVDFHRYEKPFNMKGQAVVRAFCRLNENENSEVSVQKFEVSKEKFSIKETDTLSYLRYAIDDKEQTWSVTSQEASPEFIVDLGQMYDLKGFSYTPPTTGKVFGIIQSYEFWVSTDGVQWKKILEGEFSNLWNNPKKTEILFSDIHKASHIKLKAIKTFDNSKRASCAEVGILL